MSKCKGSPPKHRHSNRGKGNDYAHGMRKHSWKKEGNIRKCVRCGFTVDARGEKLK